MMVFFWLASGLALLVFGGDALVKGAVGLAEKLGIPTLIIGLTIVAFGTSTPELFISVKAAWNGAAGIAIGNVVGSNIANVLLVMGIPAIIAASRCDDTGIGRNMLVMIGFTLVFIAMLIDGDLTRVEGFVLLVLLGMFVADQIRTARKSPDVRVLEEDVPEHPTSGWLIAAYIVGGLALLPLGAELTVDAATIIAKSWGVSDAVIGLTIVAVGTSLPELATSVMATLRKNSMLAIGNVVGSNIFNIGSIMGIAAVISPMEVDPQFVKQDIWVMLACAIVLAVLAHWKIKIGKRVGFAMIAAYAIYVGFAFAS